MILLFDIGNTHTHLGLANAKRVIRQTNIPTSSWFDGTVEKFIARLVERTRLEGAALCSVVPRATPLAHQHARSHYQLAVVELSPKSIVGIGIDYPKPATIGPDRLANAIAVAHHFGAPAVVVDFGTAVTFDVVDHQRNYIGGIIAPGLSAMTSYLHEKTALLPNIKIRETRAVVGKSTEEAMLIGAVHGYRGLIQSLLLEIKRELKCRRLPVVATGGYAKLMASKLPEITAVNPLLTLEGLRLVWQRRDEKTDKCP